MRTDSDRAKARTASATFRKKAGEKGYTALQIYVPTAIRTQCRELVKAEVIKYEVGNA